jgi:23S rRNA (uracil1939-C5)-methyltransferase
VKREFTIERFSKSGDGVAQWNGRAVFVPGALPGDRVLIEVQDQARALTASSFELIEGGADRREPACGLASKCGGCDWLAVKDTAQRDARQEIVLSTLEHLAHLDRGSFEVLPHVRSEVDLGSRRRATLHPFAGTLGFFGRKSHEHVQVDQCPALTPTLQGLPGLLAGALGTAVLKDLEELRLLECEGRVSISLHFKTPLRPRYQTGVEQLIHDGVIDGAVLLSAKGNGGVSLLGEPVLEEDGVFHRPDGFSQANAAVNRVMVRQAVELLDVRSDHQVLELYSGNGNFTLRLAALARQVVAVESSALSVALAHKALLKAKRSNVRLVQADSERSASGLVGEHQRFDRLLVDPPRSGAPGVARWASGLLVQRLVYVACDPASLARDAKALVDHGFRPLALQLFDLFPQTHHVEAVMAFER